MFSVASVRVGSRVGGDNSGRDFEISSTLIFLVRGRWVSNHKRMMMSCHRWSFPRWLGTAANVGRMRVCRCQILSNDEKPPEPLQNRSYRNQQQRCKWLLWNPLLVAELLNVEERNGWQTEQQPVERTARQNPRSNASPGLVIRSFPSCFKSKGAGIPLIWSPTLKTLARWCLRWAIACPSEAPAHLLRKVGRR